MEETQLSVDGKHLIKFESQEQQTTADVDEKLLRYILNNLLSNAIKYSPKGGSITFNLIVEQEKAIFEIQDQGIGIPVTIEKNCLIPSIEVAMSLTFLERDWDCLSLNSVWMHMAVKL